MRYVRPIDFKLNPRREISILDAVVKERSTYRYTFSEEDALQKLWSDGEDIRLREDTRFWEIEGTDHFHLAEHKLANEVLADRLWQGVWDGTDLEPELVKLDSLHAPGFHVFCTADPRFVFEQKQLTLGAASTIAFEEAIQAELNTVAIRLLEYHRENNSHLNTRQLIETVLRINSDILVAEDDVDKMTSWLNTRAEWTEVGRGLWLPTELVPQIEKLPDIRVLSVGGNGEKVTADEWLIEQSTESSHTKIDRADRGNEPPVERHPDSSVSWTHVLRTIHLLGNYLPVPTGARFRYPRFVGRDGPLIVSTLMHDTGREGFLWLDRNHNRFFGEFVAETIQWEEAGRKLLINWKPEGVVVSLGDIDCEVQLEERRHLDPNALRDLRLGRGESYRQSLVAILREQEAGLNFRSLYERIVVRQNHHPSRASIRAVLSQSPEFFCNESLWKWREIDGAANEFRKRLVLADLANSGADFKRLGVTIRRCR